MKKPIIIFISIMICIMVILFVLLRDVQSKTREAQKFNLEYEQYLNKEIYGIDIGTVINKAINNNERNGVEKNEKGLYVNNNTNSVQIDIYIDINETTYAMENIYRLGTSEFIQNFNTIAFIGKIESYHEETGQIAKILFEQVIEEQND